VLLALNAQTEHIDEQRSESARERRGDLSLHEKAAYRLNVSRIGCAVYNQLIRENATGVLDALALSPGRSLDLGGGSGWLAAELARRGFFAVSLDIEDPWERAVQIKEGAPHRDYELVTDELDAVGAQGVEFVVGDMDNVPFADESFDLLTMSAALHHSSDPVRTLREARRVLRAQGSIVCVNEPVKGLFRDPAPILHGRGLHAGERMYSTGTYLRFFHEAGLMPRLFFPAWVNNRLRQRNWSGVVYYPRLRALVARLWRLSFVRRLVKGPLLRAGMDLFGLTLIVEARK
jgi:SAM-dependent methyltransferase